MTAAAKRRPKGDREARLASVVAVLQFFRICPDEDVVGRILAALDDLPLADFRRGCDRAIVEGEHGGNVIREIRRLSAAT